MISRRTLLGVVLAGVMALAVCPSCFAQNATIVPKINIGVGTARTPEEVSSSLQILLLLTVLSLAPALLITVTSFTRIIIVLSFTRSALGSPQVPPNTVLVGVALFLTFKKVITKPSISSKIEQMGLIHAYLGPKEFETYLQKQYEIWMKLGKQYKILE